MKINSILVKNNKWPGGGMVDTVDSKELLSPSI